MSDAPVDLPSWLRWTVYIIQQVGFPVAVAGWVLYRLNGKIGALTAALVDVSAAFRSLHEAQSNHVNWSHDALTDLKQEIRAIRRSA